MPHRYPNFLRHLTSLVAVAVAAAISLATFFGSGSESFKREPAKFKCNSAPPVSYSYSVESFVKNVVTNEPLQGATVYTRVFFYSEEETGDIDVFGDKICKTIKVSEQPFRVVTNQAGIAVLNFGPVTWDSKKDKLYFTVAVTKDGWSVDADEHVRHYDNSGNTNLSANYNLTFEQWKYE